MSYLMVIPVIFMYLLLFGLIWYAGIYIGGFAVLIYLIY
jgi:hypothetical protein